MITTRDIAADKFVSEGIINRSKPALQAILKFNPGAEAVYASFILFIQACLSAELEPAVEFTDLMEIMNGQTDYSGSQEHQE